MGSYSVRLIMASLRLCIGSGNSGRQQQAVDNLCTSYSTGGCFELVIDEIVSLSSSLLLHLHSSIFVYTCWLPLFIVRLSIS